MRWSRHDSPRTATEYAAPAAARSSSRPGTDYPPASTSQPRLVSTELSTATFVVAAGPRHGIHTHVSRHFARLASTEFIPTLNAAAAAPPRLVRGISTSRPRRRRDSSPRYIRVAVAAPPRLVRGISTPRGVAAPRLRRTAPKENSALTLARPRRDRWPPAAGRKSHSPGARPVVVRPEVRVHVGQERARVLERRGPDAVELALADEFHARPLQRVRGVFFKLVERVEVPARSRQVRSGSRGVAAPKRFPDAAAHNARSTATSGPSKRRRSGGTAASDEL